MTTNTSKATTALVDTFTTAQRALVTATHGVIDAEMTRQASFAASAIAASAARKGKVTLQRLADANKAATAEIADTAPKGTLFVSLASVTVHAIVGDILSLPVLPVADGETSAPIVPTVLQSLVSKAYKSIGTKGIATALRGKRDQHAAIAALELALTVPVESADDGDTSDDGESVAVDNGQTVETLLARALAMVSNGADVTDAVKSLVWELATAVESVDVAA